MNVALVVLASLLLAGVFLWSGLSKLTDSQATARAALQFGVPSAATPVVAVALPIIELALAVCLLIPGVAEIAAGAALVLLLVFSLAICFSLLKGHRFQCNCFGQPRGGVIGWRSIARNVVLAGLAGYALVYRELTGSVSQWAWLSQASTVSIVALVVAVAALALCGLLLILVFQVLQQNGRMLLSRDNNGDGGLRDNLSDAPFGLPMGSAAPNFQIAGLDGDVIMLQSLLVKRLPILLVFVNPGCGPCEAVMPEVANWQQQLRGTMLIVPIGSGSRNAMSQLAVKHGLQGVGFQEDGSVSAAYQIKGTPSAVLITPDGHIASPTVGGADGIRQLVAGGGKVSIKAGESQHREIVPLSSRADRSTHPHNSGEAGDMPIGREVPDLILTALDGEEVRLSNVAWGERGTVLLFWNPMCSFCQRMLEDICTWDLTPPHDAPELLLVSSGDPALVRAMRLRSSVLLDSSFAAGQAFGAKGTPSAVLIGRDGRVQSSVLIGSEEVMRLLQMSANEAPNLTGHLGDRS